MVNIKNITIANDGQLIRISSMYDELSEDGKNIGTNNRITRVVTDKAVEKAIETLSNYVTNIIEEG